MLLINKNSQSQKITLTLTELEDVSGIDYFFLFKHSSTLREHSFTLPFNSDLSEFKTRYNLFNINPSELFLNVPFGQYEYKVFQQDASGKMLEFGIAHLYKIATQIKENNRTINFIENGS